MGRADIARLPLLVWILQELNSLVSHTLPIDCLKHPLTLVPPLASMRYNHVLNYCYY
jgi:hypothetical protein